MASAVAMNVLGTVMTSSPGPTSRASRANQSASVPLPTPLACCTPQNPANSRSKRSTKLPPAKALESITCSIAARSSARIGSCCRRRLRNGTCINTFRDFAENAAWIAGENRIGGDILGYHTASPDNGALPDCNSTQKRHTRANGCPTLHERGFALPFVVVLGQSFVVGGPGKTIVG